MAENARAEEIIKELLKRVDVLEQTIASLSGTNDAKKVELLLKVIKAHPDCYTTEEYAEAFGEATEKI